VCLTTIEKNERHTAWYPGVEAEGCKEREDEKDDAFVRLVLLSAQRVLTHTSTPVFARQHIDCRDQSEDDVQNAGGPYELFRKHARKPDISIT
jgi:hypothetical protein